jgi:aspartate aminotransferase
MTTNVAHLPEASLRGRNAPASPIRKLMPYANAARARGIHIHHLNIGQPDFATPAPILDAIARFDRQTVGYAPSQGMPEAVAAWASYFRQACGVEVPEEQIIVTVGGSEAISFAMMAVADPGDEILVFDPSYTNYIGVSACTGVRLRGLLLEAADDYALPSPQRIHAALTPRTRAILLCNPNNPTGAVYGEQDLRLLLDVVEEAGIMLIVDEVYRELVFDGLRQTSVLAIPGAMERTIVVDSISKRFNACGARVGCITSAHAGAMTAALRFAQARLSAPTIEQLALVPMLSDPLTYTASLAAQYERRRDTVLGALDAVPGVTHSHPYGAFYIIVGLPVEDAEDFARWMLEDFSADGETVMIAPLKGFYVTPGHGANEARLAYVLTDEDLDRAVRLLGDGLDRYRALQRGGG